MRRFFVIALTASLFVFLAAPASAKTKNPCNLLKPAEIESVLGTDVTEVGRSGPQCQWDVQATATRPSGSVYTRLYNVVAKEVFDLNKRDYAEELIEVSGLGKNAFFQPTGDDGVVWVLKGKALVTLQGAFVPIGDEPEPDGAAIQNELVELAKIARKRA